LNWISRDNNFKSRSMCEICLRRLWVIECSMSNSSPCCSDCKRSTLELSSRSISIFCSLVDYLIKGWENIISELNLCNCCVSSYCKSNSEAQNSLFWKRCIEDSINSISFTESASASKHSSKFDILSEHFGTEWMLIYVGSVSSAISMAELIAWKRFQWVRCYEEGISLARLYAGYWSAVLAWEWQKRRLLNNFIVNNYYL